MLRGLMFQIRTRPVRAPTERASERTSATKPLVMATRANARQSKYLKTRSLSHLQTPEGDDDIEPGTFSKLNAGKPRRMLCTWCGLYTFFILLMAAALPFEDSPMTTDAAAEDETSQIQQQLSGTAEAWKQTWTAPLVVCPGPPPPSLPPSPPPPSPPPVIQPGPSPPPPSPSPPPPPPPLWVFCDIQADNTTRMSGVLMYEALTSGHDLFDSASKITDITSMETHLLNTPGWTTHCNRVASSIDPTDVRCTSPGSVLNYLYLSPSEHEAGCAAGFCATNPVTSLCGTNISYGTSPCLSTVYDWRQGTLADASSWHTLMVDFCRTNPSLAWYTFPISVYTACVDGTFTGSQYLRHFYQVVSTYLTLDEFMDAHKSFTTDMSKALADGQKASSATNYMAPKVLGSPARGHDINALWYSSFEEGSVYMIADLLMVPVSVIVIFLIIWCMVGSLFLAVVGMAQIFIAFLGGMGLWLGLFQQYYVDIFQISAIFLILCIGADDIFVWTDTWKESAHEPAIAHDMVKRHAWTFHRAASGMFNTTATTVLCLLLNMTSGIPFLWCFGVFNGLVISINYAMCITFYPAAMCVYTRYLSCDSYCRCLCVCKAARPPADATVQYSESGLPRFMREVAAPGMYKARWPLMALSSFFAIGSCAATAVGWKSGEMRLLPPGNPFVEAGSSLGDGGIAADHFNAATTSSHPVIKVSLMYGLQMRASSYGDNWVKLEQLKDGFEVEVKYDDNLDFNSELQQAIVDDCDAIACASCPYTRHVSNRGAYCILNQLRDANGIAFPYASEGELFAALQAFYTTATYSALIAADSDWGKFTGFVVDEATGDIRAMWNSFNSTIPWDVEMADNVLEPYVKTWQGIANDHCSAGVGSAGRGKCFATDLTRGIFVAWELSSRVLNMAVQNIIISLGVAFAIVLVTSANWIMALLSTITIGSVMTSVLASALALGFKIDTLAAILIIMVIGMAIDYAVHMSHAYNEGHGGRKEKCSEAIQGTGISVVSGALTTIGAAIPLLFCQFLFYYKMGWFIFFVAFWGVIYSFTMLLPLLMIFGPEGTRGDVTRLLRCRLPRTGVRLAAGLEAAAHEAQAAVQGAASAVGAKASEAVTMATTKASQVVPFGSTSAEAGADDGLVQEAEPEPAPEPEPDEDEQYRQWLKNKLNKQAASPRR